MTSISYFGLKNKEEQNVLICTEMNRNVPILFGKKVEKVTLGLKIKKERIDESRGTF